MKSNIRAISLLCGALLIAVLVLSSASLGAAQENGITVVPDAVQVDSEIAPAPEDNDKAAAPAAARTAFSALGAEEIAPISVFVVFENGVDARTLEAVSEGEVVHQYSEVFNGVSLVLSPDKLDAVEAMDGVAAIYLDQLQQPDTEVSPQFIGAPTVWNMLGGQQNAAEGVIVGILDTGIWPEHPSFSDPDPFGNP